ncbi:hypothetical protein [Vibrio sp. WXL103]|uniref:hypothetical protein n=1 Tax=Vibrio sp. WXL103 TaxID=3450710 RepID=UPI003EC69AB6
MHITDKSAPWVKADAENAQPVQAIADGEIVAYRIANEYLTSTYEGNTLHYSNSFCLVKHQFTGSDESESFEFFSLYMHLAPVSVIEEAEAATIPTWMCEKVQAKTTTGVNLRRDPSRTSSGTPTAGSVLETLAKGTKFEFSTFENYEVQKIGGTDHQMAKCKTEGGKQGWLCVEESYVDVLRECPLSISDPEQVVVLSKPIPVRAGDPIGYLGCYDVAKFGGGVETRYQIHFELLSHRENKPTSEFLAAFFGEEASVELKPLENDSDSEEYLDLKLPSPFYSALYNTLNHIRQGEPTGLEMFDRFKPWDSCKQVVVRNNSEWHRESHERDFLNSLIEKVRFPSQVRQLEHEKGRIDSLVWHKKAESLGLREQVWNWWPLSEADKNINEVENMYAKLRKKLEEYENKVNHMYRCSKGKVTIGVGHMMPNYSAAQDVPFIFRDTGRLATSKEIKEEFTLISNSDLSLDHRARAYRRHTKLIITDDVIDNLTEKHIQVFEKELKVVYGKKEFDSFPTDVKLALFDMIFNLGQTTLTNVFVNFNKHINNRDFHKAAEESNRPDVNPSRNLYVRKLLEKN